MPDTTVVDRRITLRIPEILALLVDRVVGERKVRERKFSLNDWIVEAIREKIDGAAMAESVKRGMDRLSELKQSTHGGVSRDGVAFGKSVGGFLGVQNRLGAGSGQNLEGRWAPPLNTALLVESKPFPHDTMRKLQKIAAKRESDPGDAADDLALLLQGRSPAKHASWCLNHKTMLAFAEWLDANPIGGEF